MYIATITLNDKVETLTLGEDPAMAMTAVTSLIDMMTRRMHKRPTKFKIHVDKERSGGEDEMDIWNEGTEVYYRCFGKITGNEANMMDYLMI